MTNKESHIHRYAFGLDGLRAIAVIVVIFYHLGFNWAKGGFLGVDIFFVLSGYLITSVLLSQEKPNLRQFWVGRIRRLLPAAYLMILMTVAWAILFHRSLLTTLRGDALSSFFYVSNWWFIFHKVSYFDSFGSPSPLKNLWSLSIEEQFYLVWPLILLIVGRFIQKHKLVILIGSLFSAGLMAFLYHPGSDPSRIYYGTDTRSFSLLIGCWLAFIWPLRSLSAKNLPPRGRNILNITGSVSLFIFACCVIFMSEYQTFLYRGGMFLVCLNAAVLVACVSHPGSFLSDVLSWKPLRWLGKRSYGIYLWHYPSIVLTTPVYEIGHPVFWHVCLQISATLGMAELCYRFVEMPIRRRGFRYYFYQYRPQNILKWHHLTLLKKIVVIFSIFLFTIYVSDITYFVLTSKGGNHTKLWVALGKWEKSDHLREIQAQSIENNGIVNGEKAMAASKDNRGTYDQILAIGDSVLLDVAPELLKTNSNMTIDGKVGRQLADALRFASSYKQFNSPNKAVIFELGTNGYFTSDQLNQLVRYFAKTHIYLINTRVPRSWESEVNRSLKQIARDSANVTLIDWYSLAINHPEYFAPDGVHLTPDGASELASLIDMEIHKKKE